MRVSIFNVRENEKSYCQAVVNGAEAVSKYWAIALLKAIFRSFYNKERHSLTQKILIFRKYFISLN